MKICRQYWPLDSSDTNDKDLSLSLHPFLSKTQPLPSLWVGLISSCDKRASSMSGGWMSCTLHLYYHILVSSEEKKFSLLRARDESQRRTRIGCAESRDSSAQWRGLQGRDTVIGQTSIPCPPLRPQRRTKEAVSLTITIWNCTVTRNFPKKDDGRVHVQT